MATSLTLPGVLVLPYPRTVRPSFFIAYGGSPDTHHSALPVRIDVDVPTLQSVRLLWPQTEHPNQIDDEGVPLRHGCVQHVQLLMADVGVGNVGQWLLDPDVDGRIAADQRLSCAFHLLRARLREHGAHERGDMPSDAGSGAIARHVHRIDRLAQQGFGDLVHAVHAQSRNQVVPQVLAVFSTVCSAKGSPLALRCSRR